MGEQLAYGVLSDALQLVAYLDNHPEELTPDIQAWIDEAKRKLEGIEHGNQK